MQLTEIIMAGGKSGRMDAEKGMVKFKNKYLIEYSLDALKTSCSKILISANNDEYSIFGYPVIKDLVPDAGPMGGIVSCLVASPTDFNLVLACDMPMVDGEIINPLKSMASSASIVVYENPEGRLEPICGSYHKNIQPFLAEKIRLKEYNLSKAILSADHKILSLPGPRSAKNSDVFININKPADLVRIQRSC